MITAKADCNYCTAIQDCLNKKQTHIFHISLGLGSGLAATITIFVLSILVLAGLIGSPAFLSPGTALILIPLFGIALSLLSTICLPIGLGIYLHEKGELLEKMKKMVKLINRLHEGFSVCENRDSYRQASGQINSALPSEIFTEIFSHLEEKDISNCRLVCSKWNRHGDQGLVWKNRLKDTHPNCSVTEAKKLFSEEKRKLFLEKLKNKIDDFSNNYSYDSDAALFTKALKDHINELQQ